MKNVIWICGAVLICLGAGCSKSSSTPTPPKTTDTTYTPPAVASTFAKGADISWVTQMEASSYKFYSSSGQQEDLFALMKSLGMNSIRLRAWVNPVGGWCNTTDLVSKAIRAKNAGMKILIDFHYSDTWADPGDQNKPAAWANLSTANLITTMASYTVGVMDTLKLNGITPDWVQVGNETSNGMLWPDGEASINMANFAAMILADYNAVKSVSSTTKVIVHLANGYDNTTYTWLFDGLKSNGAKWDIIGMSLYPTISNYTTLDQECLANINSMVSRYGTPVMVVEVGMEEDQALITRDYLTDIITKVNSVANGNGLGVFYWEPEAYNWQNYGLGAFTTAGKPTIALNAFAN